MGDVVLYHANCMDGFAAAWAAWKALGDAATYIPVQYGQPIPEIPEGSRVYLLDFSYKKQQLLDLAARVGTLTVIDHHKTAQADLVDFPLIERTYIHFDMKHSGARLAWDYFSRNSPIPLLIDYVEDRDLWVFGLPKAKEVAAWLWTIPFEFVGYDGAAAALDVDLHGVARQGAAILSYMEKMCEMSLSHVHMARVGGHVVPCVNASHFFSELGELMCTKYPESPFACVYFQRADGLWVHSLRSRGEFDVADVAQQQGGGGHRNAAGFQSRDFPRE